MLETEKWLKVKQIFQTALELPAAERSAYIETATEGDADVRDEVAALLTANDEAADFIERPAFTAADLFENKPRPSLIGNEIGSYKILSEIGRGGMGVVYLAERADTEFTKKAAVKLIKRGFDTDEIIDRFRNERQILANLEHPNIARLLDGGSTEDGLPFLVMEYVEGLPFNRFCADQDLDIEERLRLFREVCSAVQHAHRNLVVHRDLKPSNILVDENGAPKLLDFGIAKLLSTSDRDRGQTATNFNVMTPEYASPEQMRGEMVTTATDVYSLGVVLYELLTGNRPFSFQNESLENIVQTICHSEPLKPSSMIVSRPDPDRSATTGGRDPRVLRGDLDNIILMALRKEPERRYLSVEQFSEDIRRYQEGLPVIAREDSYSYRAGKFVQRNKLAVAAFTGVGISLVAGILSTTRQARIAKQQHEKAAKINKYLQNMLSSADPRAAGKNAKVVEVLKIAAGSMDKEFAESPEIVADLRSTIGLTFLSIGQIAEAEPHLTEALNVRERFYGKRNAETAMSLNNYGKLLQAKGDLKAAEEYYRGALRILRRNGSPLDMAAVLGNLGHLLLLEGNYDEAKKLQNRKLEIVSGVSGEGHPEFAQTLSNLANVYSVSGDKQTAERMHRRAVRLTEAIYASDHPDVALSKLHLAITIMADKLDEAERLIRETLASRRKFYGEGHVETAWSQYYLCEVFLRRKDYLKVAEYANEILGWRGASIPETHSVISSTLLTLSRGYIGLGRADVAEPLLLECVKMRKQTLPADHWLIATAEGHLARCFMKLGHLDEAYVLLERSYKVLMDKLGEDHEHTASVRQSLSEMASRRYA